MKKESLWKRITAVGLTAAMLMTGVSTGFAEETVVVPEVLAGEGSFSDEEARAYSADINIVEDGKVEGEEAVTYGEEQADSLIEDPDILQASDDSEEMITITFDAGDGSNFWVWDEEIGDWTYNGGPKRVEEAYSGDIVQTPFDYDIQAEGKRLKGWTDSDNNYYEPGEECTFYTDSGLGRSHHDHV